MQVTTIADARALVGRTFERDGSRATFNGVVRREKYIDLLVRDDLGEQWYCMEYVSDWLSKASEVHDA
jgi:hypothetical protein